MDEATERPFGFWMAIALVIGGMIGSAIFVLPAQLAPVGATGVAAWLVAIAGTLVIAWVLTKLTAARPQATGAVALCADALGPLPGVLVGWSYWIGIWCANAIIAITAARYLGVLMPALAATPPRIAATATAIIALLTLLNLGGAKAAGRFQVVTTVLKLLPLVAVVLILGGLAIRGGGAMPTYSHAGFSAAALTPALTLVFFAMVGFESASLVTERVRDPARNVVRATLAGLTLTGLICLIVCCGVIYALPEHAVAEASAPVALFVATFWGQGAALAVATFAVVATVGCLNGWVLMQGEVPLGMARAGLLPRWFARTRANDVPVGILLLSSALACVLVLSNATRGGAGVLDFMLRLTTGTTLWMYVGLCAAALRLGVARGAAAVGLAFALWVFVGTGLEAGAWSLVLMATAVPLYWLRGTAAQVTSAAR